MIVFPSQDNVTSTKSSSNLRLPRAATIFFWKLFHFKQKCSCGIVVFSMAASNWCVGKICHRAIYTKSVGPEITFNCRDLLFCGKMFNSLVYLKHKPIILFLPLFPRSFSWAKETYNWKMSLLVRVQRKALKFECDELKKSFHKKEFLSTSNDFELM